VFKRLRWFRLSVLAFSAKVRGFKPGRNRRIFQGRKKKFSARLPSEGKSWPVLSHVADLRHVKEPVKVALTRYFQAKFTGHFSPQ
jgi:hypothetical protein